MINYKKERHKSIKIEWTKNLKGDFSFKEKWSYQEGIYKNQFGQLSCDGNCPIEIDGMKDEFGKINKDSLQSFYKMIDTTHVFHSLYSNNRMYEYSGTNFIEFEKLENGIIRGKSTNNASTHSNLVLELKNNLCSAFVELNSIRNLGKNKFPLKSGNIKIDKNLFEKGIVKAKFHFKFKNVIEPDKELFWNGMIYSKINNKHTKQVHKQ
ncbi:MAG: hypothetical protein CSA38_02670 [Flavobacteriales bacterium]|nr:MAG: hypothetical protein CSA38_02670 [Flavobacteriales bacterium]